MRYKTIIGAILLAFGLLPGVRGQHEGLVVFTDRGHYISGETINFRALYRIPEGGGAGQWSRILYVELILPNGTPLVQGKVLIDTTGATGTIAIPEGLSSGTYYLKAYTRWMRNCGPEGFVYTSIRVYDPYNDQVLPVDSTGWEPQSAGEIFYEAKAHTPDLLECKLEKRSISATPGSGGRADLEFCPLRRSI